MSSASDSTPQAAQAIDRLLFITDLHFWEVVLNPLKLLNKRMLGNANVWLRRRHHFHMERANDFADAAAATGAKTVLLGGDFTSTATEGEFALAKTFLERLRAGGLEIVIIPGNHDVYTFEAARKRRFERYFADYLRYEALPALHRLPGGVPLILAPTACPNLISSRGRITPREVEAVAALIDGAPAGPLLVAGHYPVLQSTYAYNSGFSRRLRNAALLRQVLGAAGREMIYLSGHVHRFSFVRDPRHPRLCHLTTSAFFLQRPQSAVTGEFSEIMVLPREVRVIRRWRETNWTAETVPPR